MHTPIDVLYNTNETEKITALAKQEPDDPMFPNGGIRICSVAKLMPTKGYDRLLNAHKRLLDEGLMHSIYIIGIGEEQKPLESQAVKLGVEKSFHMIGSVIIPISMFLAVIYTFVLPAARAFLPR